MGGRPRPAWTGTGPGGLGAGAALIFWTGTACSTASRASRAVVLEPDKYVRGGRILGVEFDRIAHRDPARFHG
jgi:hypothetical protein